MSSESDRLNYPGAPPDKVRGAIETLFLEWQAVQAERAQWKLERSQLRQRIIQLESEARNHEKVRLDLIRRIKLLEHGLLSERMNYVSGAAPSRFATNDANGVAGKPSRANHLVANGHPTNKGRFYRTLPSDFLASPNSWVRNVSPGRQFLREYLIELGYIKEAEQLDGRRSGIPESKFEQEPVKLPSTGKSSVSAISTKREALPSESEWAGASNSPSDKPKGSYAKPNVKPANVTAARRGSADALLLEQKAGDAKRWKSTVSLRSHLDSVRCLSWHSTEAAIVTGSEDGTAKLWNLSDEISLTPNKKKKVNPLEPNYTFRGHHGMITSVVLADQLKYVFTAGTDCKIFAWELPPLNFDTYDEIGKATKFRKQILDAHKDAVWNLCVHPIPSQALLFSVSADGAIATWKVDFENPIRLLRTSSHLDKSSSPVIPTSLAVMNSDMKKLLVGFKSGEVGQVDIETGTVIRIMHSAADTNATSSSNAGNFHINDIVSHPSLSLAITAHVDNNVRIFDVSQGSCVSVMQTHRDAVTSVALDHSGLYLASASHDQSLRFWDMTSKKIIQDLDGYQTHRSKYDEAIHMVRYHSSMPLVATCGADSVAKVYQ